MKKEDLITLKILPEEHGYSIYLDEKKLHHVEGYDIKSSDIPGAAELLMKILVKYP